MAMIVGMVAHQPINLVKLDHGKPSKNPLLKSGRNVPLNQLLIQLQHWMSLVPISFPILCGSTIGNPTLPSKLMTMNQSLYLAESNWNQPTGGQKMVWSRLHIFQTFKSVVNFGKARWGFCLQGTLTLSLGASTRMLEMNHTIKSLTFWNLHLLATGKALLLWKYFLVLSPKSNLTFLTGTSPSEIEIVQMKTGMDSSSTMSLMLVGQIWIKQKCWSIILGLLSMSRLLTFLAIKSCFRLPLPMNLWVPTTLSPSIGLSSLTTKQSWTSLEKVCVWSKMVGWKLATFLWMMKKRFQSWLKMLLS